jgi:hypothetical protein
MFKVGDIVKHINTGDRIFKIVSVEWLASRGSVLIADHPDKLFRQKFGVAINNLKLVVSNKQSNIPMWF